mmetsp:Transcript_35235/g.77159  ORF Transcript_35235/g.77159 Transcript_35235/m.77159 type:complete len:1750 (-) Transcript_35235:1573-6822(-)
MPSVKPSPHHYPPRKVNKKPSDDEPVKSYEKTSKYLEDDVFLSVQDEFHKEHGNLMQLKPPKTHAHAAAPPFAAASSALGGTHTPQKPFGGNVSGLTQGGGLGIVIAPVKKSTENKGTRSLLHRNISSFDDAAGLNAGSNSSDVKVDTDALSRSPGSCPTFTNDDARAYKQTRRGESLASAISTLTEEEEEFAGGYDSYQYDQAAFMQKWPSEAVPTKPRGKSRKKSNDSDNATSSDNLILEDVEDAPSPIPSPRTTARKIAAEKAAEKRQAKAKTNEERRKHAKFLSKKRARLRDIRHDELLGSAEHTHDSTLSLQDDDDIGLAIRTTSQLSLDDNRSPRTLGGKRKERIEFELGKASVTNRLVLRGLNLRAKELPIPSILSFPLGKDLKKLCLAGNNLNHLPEVLVHSLQGLRTMDLQQCGLFTLPDDWDLPNLRRLNLSHNYLKTFLSENAVRGLPSLECLSMSNNDIYDFTLPDSDGPVLENLDYLNLEFNNISLLPEEDLPRLGKLRELRLSNNYLTHVPRAVCHMQLSDLDVTPNPLIQPPLGDCEQGIGAMRRYYAGLEHRERRRSRLDDESTPSPKQRRRRFQQRRRQGRSISDLAPVPNPSMGEQRRFHGTSALAAAANLRGGAMPRVQTVPLQAGTLPLHVVPPPAAFAITDPREECALAVNNVEMESMSSENSVIEAASPPESAPTVINDTLKIVFVGNSRSGKTTSMLRLKKGMLASIPKKEESTIGISIDSWDPKVDCKEYSIDASRLNTTIVQEDSPTRSSAANADIKFSLWDFAGQDVYHATHSIFFSPSALYVLMWDMGWDNKATQKVVEPSDECEDGPYQWLDSDDEDEDEKDRRAQQIADKALDDDIDKKVGYWIDCIRATVPGAAILPVATHDDKFDDIGGPEEAKRRCRRMKDRILRNEERRVESLRKRLTKLENDHRASAPAAIRIRELLSQYRLPKIVFDDDDDSPDPIIRVSGKYDTRFGALRERILALATGRATSCTNFRRMITLASGKNARSEDYTYPLFRGHVGSPIPPFRLKIRELVREKRKDFQVVEWNHFSSMVEESIGYRPLDADLNDALRFLSRIGEISFFGEVEGLEERPHIACSRFKDDIFYDTSDDEDCGDNEYTPTPAPESLQRKAIAADMSAKSLPPGSQVKLSGLSQFVFTNPLWLAVTLRCVLRHDLKQQLDETRSKISTPSRWANYGRADSFHNSALRCPILRSSDARSLWESNGKLAKSAKKAIQDDPGSQKSAFTYMEQLLVHFGVFVPISLNIDQVLIDGEVYSPPNRDRGAASSSFYFLPSQLQPREGPTEDAWTYKTNDATKICLCHTWLFHDGAPPSLMERLTSSVLRTLYSATTFDNRCVKSNGQLSFHRILCWKGAFKISLAKSYVDVDGYSSETMVDIWAQLEEQSSPTCVAGESTGDGLKRLIISAKGQEANGTQNIWEGGLSIVLDEADRVIREYRGLDFIRQPACPTCLDTREVRQAAVWDWPYVRDAIRRKRHDMCCQNGHEVDIRYLAGKQQGHKHVIYRDLTSFASTDIVPYTELCAGVVLIGLWDGEKVVMTGSGFVVDAKRGLIVTAAHNAIDMRGANEPRNTVQRSQSKYYGFELGRMLIGVITADTSKEHNPNSPVGPEASWRYFGEIAAEDICNMDAVVLRIRGRLRTDVEDTNDIISQPVDSLEREADFENEPLHQLSVTTKADLEEKVRLIGYSQGGDGLVPRGHSINRSIEVTQGHVAKKESSGRFA